MENTFSSFKEEFEKKFSSFTEDIQKKNQINLNKKQRNISSTLREGFEKSLEREKKINPNFQVEKKLTAFRLPIHVLNDLENYCEKTNQSKTNFISYLIENFLFEQEEF